jgi:hypothetical protein
MDESENDEFIKDLLYPALENSSSREMDFDFFEEDYNEALAAVSHGRASQAGSQYPSYNNHDNSSRNSNYTPSSSAVSPRHDYNSQLPGYYSSLRRENYSSSYDPPIEKIRR